jgi:hypothetical protein
VLQSFLAEHNQDIEIEQLKNSPERQKVGNMKVDSIQNNGIEESDGYAHNDNENNMNNHRLSSSSYSNKREKDSRGAPPHYNDIGADGNLYICLYIYKYIHIYIHYIHTYLYICTYMYTYIHLSIHVCIDVHM